jgi:glycosyltransferase involved in cell wall biosynthesis
MHRNTLFHDRFRRVLHGITQTPETNAGEPKRHRRDSAIVNDINPRSLRIAFIGARGVGNAYSGIETYYEEVGSRLVDRGHKVLAYCRTYFTPDISKYRGIDIKRIRSVRSKHLDTFVHSFFSTLDVSWRDFDIVQYHALGPSLFSIIPRVFGLKTIASVRGLDWEREKWGDVASLFLKGCEFASARLPTATVVVSKKLRNYYAEKYGQTPMYIPNGVLTPILAPPARIRKFGLEKGNFLLFAGRLSPEKGCHYLLEALRSLDSKVKLVFAGGSSYSEGYMRKLRAMAWQDVVFLGFVDRETMAELYSNCYAFVLPSEMEGLSISLLESLSYGNCIIASDIEENREVVEDAGLCFRSGDVESLRSALKTILEDSEIAKSYRKKAQEIGRDRFNWDEITRQTEQFYYKILRQESGLSEARQTT